MVIEILTNVTDFVCSLDPDTQSKYRRTRDLLEKFGHELSMPFSKNIGKGLFELRIKGRQEVRILYCFYSDRAWLLHGFLKKTQEIPLRQIQIAQGRKKLLTNL